MPYLSCPSCGSANLIRRGVTSRSKGTQNEVRRYACNDCGKWTVESNLLSQLMEDEDDVNLSLTDQQVNDLSEASGYIITGVMNNTPLHHPFWASILKCAEVNNYRVIVGQCRYRNPTSKNEETKLNQTISWPPEVRPYMTSNRIPLHKKLMFMGDVRIVPTAKNPLSGIEDLTKDQSAVFLHPQVAMRCIPTPQHDLPKIMYTTGSASVSEGSYSESKAGVRGEFHHSLGAIIVEKEAGRFHMRSVVGDEFGGFHDLCWYYTGDSVERWDASAIVTGDEHIRFRDPKCEDATYRRDGSLVKLTRPKTIVRHDIQDSYSVSSWHRKKLFTRYAKHITKTANLLDELNEVVEYVDSTTPEGAENLIIASNHHAHILRWIEETDPRTDLENLRAWCQLTDAVAAETSMGPAGAEYPDPFELWARDKFSAPTRFLSRRDQETIEGILITLHGDEGSNGGKGSIKGLSQIGVKTVIAHSHTPGIEKGCYQVGTSSYLLLEYTSGPSSWIHTHCLIFPNGKRQLVHIIDGHFHGNARVAKLHGGSVATPERLAA